MASFAVVVTGAPSILQQTMPEASPANDRTPVWFSLVGVAWYTYPDEELADNPGPITGNTVDS